MSQKLTEKISEIKIDLSGFMLHLIQIEQSLLENSERLLFELPIGNDENKMETGKIINEKLRERKKVETTNNMIKQIVVK